jgi:hypothetical protein
MLTALFHIRICMRILIAKKWIVKIMFILSEACRTAPRNFYN